MRRVLTPLAILWAAPWTLFGLLIGVTALAFKAKVRRHGRVLEFYDGGVTWFLQTFPLVSNAAAVTFGHVVLALDRQQLDACRDHELVHVAQYERWGPAFVPAYLLCSLWLRLRGDGDWYRDNPFEREAYERTQ